MLQLFQTTAGLLQLLATILIYRIKQQMKRGLQHTITCLQMQGAYQLQRLIFIVIEGQANKSHLLATAIVDVQNKFVRTPAVNTSCDTQHTFLL
jgi:hypothetical protein